MMNFQKHFPKDELGPGRIEAFSDRVFAIVVFGVVIA
jgi:uncharacterized membrane protein